MLVADTCPYANSTQSACNHNDKEITLSRRPFIEPGEFKTAIQLEIVEFSFVALEQRPRRFGTTFWRGGGACGPCVAIELQRAYKGGRRYELFSMCALSSAIDPNLTVPCGSCASIEPSA